MKRDAIAIDQFAAFGIGLGFIDAIRALGRGQIGRSPMAALAAHALDGRPSVRKDIAAMLQGALRGTEPKRIMCALAIVAALKSSGLPIWALHAFGVSDGSIEDIAALGGTKFSRNDNRVIMAAVSSREQPRTYPPRRRSRTPRIDVAIMADIRIALGAIAS